MSALPHSDDGSQGGQEREEGGASGSPAECCCCRRSDRKVCYPFFCVIYNISHHYYSLYEDGAALDSQTTDSQYISGLGLSLATNSNSSTLNSITPSPPQLKHQRSDSPADNPPHHSPGPCVKKKVRIDNIPSKLGTFSPSRDTVYSKEEASRPSTDNVTSIRGISSPSSSVPCVKKEVRIDNGPSGSGAPLQDPFLFKKEVQIDGIAPLSSSPPHIDLTQSSSPFRYQNQLGWYTVQLERATELKQQLAHARTHLEELEDEYDAKIKSARRRVVELESEWERAVLG